MSQGTRISPELAATAGQWTYVCCQCLVKTGRGSGGVFFTYECAACGNTNLRFIHTLENDEDGRQLWVGIECARTLLDPSDSEIPTLAENETKRKEGWRVHYGKPGPCYTTIEDLENRGKL
jgi:hypothetical protein